LIGKLPESCSFDNQIQLAKRWTPMKEEGNHADMREVEGHPDTNLQLDLHTAF
jgi:hypothetical protein